MIQLPSGSIYFWMYSEGLKRTSLQDICVACKQAGITIREKDFQNYWNGYYHGKLYVEKSVLDFGDAPCSPFYEKRYEEYEEHPYLELPEISRRWVPCNAAGRPLIKWSLGCMDRIDAASMTQYQMVAENMHMTKMIVIDCDGDHTENLDYETIGFLSKWIDKTHCLYKDKTVSEYNESWYPEHMGCANLPASYHLTFMTDRVIPTMHFPKAHIDVIGNKQNSLRYWKNKIWNQLPPMEMTTEIWEQLKDYIAERESR
jgi:hypothetical protein